MGNRNTGKQKIVLNAEDGNHQHLLVLFLYIYKFIIRNLELIDADVLNEKELDIIRSGRPISLDKDKIDILTVIDLVYIIANNSFISNKPKISRTLIVSCYKHLISQEIIDGHDLLAVFGETFIFYPKYLFGFLKTNKKYHKFEILQQGFEILQGGEDRSITYIGKIDGKDSKIGRIDYKDKNFFLGKNVLKVDKIDHPDFEGILKREKLPQKKKTQMIPTEVHLVERVSGKNDGPSRIIDYCYHNTIIQRVESSLQGMRWIIKNSDGTNTEENITVSPGLKIFKKYNTQILKSKTVPEVQHLDPKKIRKPNRKHKDFLIGLILNFQRVIQCLFIFQQENKKMLNVDKASRGHQLQELFLVKKILNSYVGTITKKTISPQTKK